MTRRVGPFVGLAGAALVAGVVSAPLAHASEPAADGSAVAAARQSFVGEWQLNTALSDDAREKLRDAGPGGRGGPPAGGPFGGSPGGRGGPGGWARRGGGGMGRERRGPGAPAGGMLFEADRITITNLTPEITIVAPEGGLRTLHADDKDYRDSSGGTVKTRWDGARLLVETKGERGGVKEAWTVSAGPRRLTVLLEVQRPFGGTVTIKRVFDPLPAAPPESSEP